jgi:predicted transcriptional regulator
MELKAELIDQFVSELHNDSNWSSTIEKISSDSTIGVHLAVFNEPFLTLILNGVKKIESRFSINKISPFKKVNEGDLIILQESGGPVKGAFISGNVKYYENINENILQEIEKLYGQKICSSYDKEFWKNRNKANYASLIEVKNVKKVNPFKSQKRDRSGWSILKERFSNQFIIEGCEN